MKRVQAAAPLAATPSSSQPSLVNSATLPLPRFSPHEKGDLLAKAVLQPPFNGVVPLKKAGLERFALSLPYDSRNNSPWKLEFVHRNANKLAKTKDDIRRK